jgi:hypothetical protein
MFDHRLFYPGSVLEHRAAARRLELQGPQHRIYRLLAERRPRRDAGGR